jgi:ferritin-like metal-binding protein YciE
MIRLFTTTTFNSLDDLLIEQLADLYDAEKRLIDALPKMAEAAHSPQLQSAFREHLQQTKNHARIVEECFRGLNKEPHRETCAAMKGLIQEGEEMVNADGDPAVKDAALIAAAQRVEHYEISGYGTARTFAERLGYQDAARKLQQILDEEKATDKKLTEIAEQNINLVAAEHSR